MYTIYRITDGRFSYIGMTKQSLSRRLSQHKADSMGGCSVTKKMCKKEKPSDLLNCISIYEHDRKTLG